MYVPVTVPFLPMKSVAGDSACIRHVRSKGRPRLKDTFRRR